ncbi:helix-turn-helix transcriptional regulator [Plantibacter sp. RU18]|uniref:helix-turn-helix transcriptional regulator n=1 Tax=Plantibacter sp. RU18 TaxID=3158143 RepID=UPI003D3662E6
MDRPALADFLLKHRSALQPADVGLSTGARRRTAGLRREEVAQLAAMSTDYYARLEQQRGPQPSTQMLGALARALRLTAEERDYLYRIAGQNAPTRLAATDFVAPPLLRVLDRLTDSPALILSALGETLVQNDAARALFGEADHLTGFERSAIYRWFVLPEQERRMYPPDDRERHSRAQVASLRAAYGSMGAESQAGEMVAELSRRSEEFVQLWASHEVGRRFEAHKVLIHPEIGPLELDCQALFTEDQSQALLVLTAAPHSDAEGKLKLLTVLGTQAFSSRTAH